ncbi:hypothetical protein [Streptomyces liliifuscus]|uniref:Uncharacterized protein n=1 Tax=Streptomyces liliifuscus TaxID=2797636 RepID=A0A7T7I6N3_9ACTN|nr:hypothetical protein [Streptomyces liliifuscus]QQM42009.1 hypothetical protein JEQ17_22905 [Streptomyces liliifuscus]
MVRCFVIGPIGNKFAPLDDPGRRAYEDSLQVFEDVIQAACQKLDIDPVRADQIAVAGEITEQVFRHLYEDDVVIADVSGGNPNVMYELGLRHTTGKLTIQIGEFGQLPFDVAAIRTIQFSRSRRGLIDARNELERSLQAGLVDGQDLLTATRVLQEVASGQVEITLPSVEGAFEGAVEDDSPGLLERMEEVESGLGSMVDDANAITEAMQRIGMVTEISASEINMANQSGASNKDRLTLVTKFAAEVSGPADQLEESSNSFAYHMESLNEGISTILKVIQKSEPDELPDGAADFLDQLIAMAETSREGMEGLNTFGVAAQGMASLSRQLRGPGKKIDHAVSNMRRAIANIDAWERMARSIKSEMEA